MAIAIGDDGRGLAGTVEGGDGRPAGIGNGKGLFPERPFAVSGRTLGIDVKLPLRIAILNGARRQVSGRCPFGARLTIDRRIAITPLREQEGVVKDDQGNTMAGDRNWLIDHTGIGVSDIHKSKRFYEAALRPLTIRVMILITRGFKLTDDEGPDLGGVGYGVDYPIFWIDVFHRHDAKQHTAFRAVSRKQVDEFHAEAFRAGGVDNGAPGLRAGGYPPGYYAAFVLDPDGNNIEAVFREK